MSVSNSLLRKIVIDDKGVHGVVSEVLTNSTSRVGSEELKRGGLRSSSSNNDSVFHGVIGC